MNNTKEEEKYSPLIIASLILSIAIGIIGFLLINHNKTANPDRILNNIKSNFREGGILEGSWIEMTKVPLNRASIQKDVYYGGLSRLEEDEIKHYEFIADAYSGNLIDLYEI